MSTQISADKERVHFGIYRKLPTPTTAGVRKEYSEDEVAEFVEAFSDVKVMPNLSFAELYENTTWTTLVNQNEGLMKHWYHGRVVLAGDSCAVMTAAAGMGVNNGIQSAVALVNKLHEAVVLSSGDGASSETETEILERAFAEYQNTRRAESQSICDISATMIRVNTWDTYMSRFLGDFLFPWLMPDNKLMAKISNDLVRGMRKFDFIDAELKSGKVAWANP